MIFTVDKVMSDRVQTLSQRVIFPRVTEQKPYRIISVGLLYVVT